MLAAAKSRIIYDWVSMTFKKHSVEDVIALLGLNCLNWQVIKGAHGYRDRWYSEYISIHYNGRDDMGVWLEMSGKGCRIFETYGNGNFDKLLRMALDPDNCINLTRLDVAFDDFGGLLDIDRLCDAARYQHVVTRFHETSWQVVFGGKGNSILFGSKKSEILVRIYDKDAEQGREEGRHWVRVELQMRRDRALGFVKAAQTMPSIGERFRGVLANYVRFVIPTNDTNKRRWSTAYYWERLLDNAAAISIYEKPEIDYTLADLEAYVIRQAGNAIDAYISYAGLGGLRESLNNRTTRPNPKYASLLQSINKPLESREPTADEIYQSGLEYATYCNYDSAESVVDIYGHRWLKCDTCGFIYREDEMSAYGGEYGAGRGRCTACTYEHGTREYDAKALTAYLNMLNHERFIF